MLGQLHAKFARHGTTTILRAINVAPTSMKKSLFERLHTCTKLISHHKTTNVNSFEGRRIIAGSILYQKGSIGIWVW